MGHTPRSIPRATVAQVLRPVPIRIVKRRPVTSAVAIVAVVATALMLLLTAGVYYRASGVTWTWINSPPVEVAQASEPPRPPMMPGRPAAVIVPRDRRGDEFAELQREFDVTVPQLVAGQSRVEQKVDQLQQDVRSLQIAQLAIEQLLVWAKGLAMILGGLVLTTIGGLIQSWTNGMELRKQAGEKGRG